MNNTIKISLTINLEGGALVRKSEPEVIKYVITAKTANSNKKKRSKDNFKVVEKGSFKHFSYETAPASQHINMTEEAYKYMTSECPYWVKPKVWNKLNKKERLELHLQRTCEHFHGTSYSYTILDD